MDVVARPSQYFIGDGIYYAAYMRSLEELTTCRLEDTLVYRCIDHLPQKQSNCMIVQSCSLSVTPVRYYHYVCRGLVPILETFRSMS